MEFYSSLFNTSDGVNTSQSNAIGRVNSEISDLDQISRILFEGTEIKNTAETAIVC